MTNHIYFCPKCRRYTMEKTCCVPTILPRPPKYSPEDKYGKYRRKAKIIED